MPMETELLTRDAFREQCLLRDRGLCVVPGCGSAASEVHHILERRLFADGGYYMANGASVCNPHHLDCERTIISCDDMRLWCGIHTKLYPPDIDPPTDKWGNPLLEDGKRAIGPLFFDPSVQKILSDLIRSGVFVQRVKFPRTAHAPWSLGVTKTHGEPDDVVLGSVPFRDGDPVVITEKLDGQNCTMYYGEGNVHARSLDGRSHPSQSYVRAFHARVAYDIPQGMRIVGENVQAVHSLRYVNIPPFLVFAIFQSTEQGWQALAWREIEEWCALLDLPHAPMLYTGPYHEQLIRARFDWRPGASPASAYGVEREGYVVRSAGRFMEREMADHVMKVVRPNHVRTDRHWMYKELEENILNVR